MKQVSRWKGLGVICIHGLLPVLLFYGSAAYAQFTLPSAPGGLPEEGLPVLLARIIKSALGLVAVLALLFIVYGGFLYIMSRGDERETETAKNIITYAVVGVIVIGIAYALVSFTFGLFKPN